MVQALPQEASVNINEVMLVKALLASRDVLIEDLQRIGEAIGRAIDLAGFFSTMDDPKFVSAFQSNLSKADAEYFGDGKPHNGIEVLCIFYSYSAFSFSN